MFSINYNGKNNPSFMRVRTVEITVLPAISHNFLNITGVYGSVETGSSFGEKTISVSVVFEKPDNKSLAEMGRELAAWLVGNNFKLGKLILSDDPDIYYMAKVSSASAITDLLVAGEATFDFIVPSGLGIGPTKVASFPNHNGSTGTESMSIEYKGTAPSLPVIEFVAKGDYANGVLNISDKVSGKTIRLKGNFKANEVVTINCAKKVVLQGGKSAQKLLEFNTEWIGFTVGSTCEITGSLLGNYTFTYTENYC